MQHDAATQYTDTSGTWGSPDTATSSTWFQNQYSNEYDSQYMHRPPFMASSQHLARPQHIDRSKHMLKDSENRDATSGVIGKLTCACLQILAATDRALKESGELPRQRILLARATQALMLWNERHNVLKGELDGVLNKSKRLQRIVLNSLGMIAREITAGIHHRLAVEIQATLIKVAGKWRDEVQSLLQLVSGETDDLAASNDTSESASDDDDDDGDTLQSHLNDLISYVGSLLDLDSALSTPAIDVDAPSQPSTKGASTGAQQAEISNSPSIVADINLSPETPMESTDMSDWDGSYSDQTQYPSAYYGTEQQWYPNDNGYSTGYIEPPTSYIMSPVDNMDPMNFQYPQSMSMPTSIPMQDSVLIPEVEVPNTSHICTVPGCESKTSFKRKADLMRHLEEIHQAPEQKKQFYCDYSKCERSKEPFGRIDHFRQHYRDFHGEDLSRKSGESPKWYADKKQSVSKRHWRCVKCLNKVKIEDSGFTCDNCNTPCETQRRQIRGYT